MQHDKLSEEEKVEARKLLSVAFMEEVKDFDNENSLLQYLSTAVSINSLRPENTVSHGAETSKIGESDQLNLDASSQDALISMHPDRGTFGIFASRWR